MGLGFKVMLAFSSLLFPPSPFTVSLLPSLLPDLLLPLPGLPLIYLSPPPKRLLQLCIFFIPIFNQLFHPLSYFLYLFSPLYLFYLLFLLLPVPHLFPPSLLLPHPLLLPLRLSNTLILHFTCLLLKCLQGLDQLQVLLVKPVHCDQQAAHLADV